MSTPTIGHIKDSKYRSKLRQRIIETGLEVPGPSAVYDLGLLSLLHFSQMAVRPNPLLEAFAEWEAKNHE